MSNFLPDTGGKGGHLFKLTCSVVLWEGRNTANKYHGTCGECSQCMDHTGFVSAHGTCALPVYTTQAPDCSAGELSKVGSRFCALPRSKLLWFRFSGTHKGSDSDGHAFCALPRSEQLRRPSAWRVHCLRWAVRLNHLPCPRCSVSWVCSGAPSQVCCVSPLGCWFLAATLLADVNHLGSQEDLVRNWEPAHSLVEDTISGAKIALAFRLWLSPACLSSSGGRIGQCAAG